MIKFFRHIRQRMIKENSVSKYMLYAIGEIVLVVVGILIALSINNWNQNQRELDEEKKVLIQLQHEYKLNLEQLDQKIYMRDIMLESALKILSYVDHPEDVVRDSLMRHLYEIQNDPTFDPISNDLISSGNLRLIQNNNLRQMLSSWSSNVYQLQEIELQWQHDRTEIVTPFYISLGIMRDVTNSIWKDGFTPVNSLDSTIEITNKLGNSERIISVEEILSAKEIEGIAADAIDWNEIANIQSHALRNQILEILIILEQEMEL